MNEYGSGDMNQRKSILKPLSAGKKRTAQAPQHSTDERPAASESPHVAPLNRRQSSDANPATDQTQAVATERQESDSDSDRTRTGPAFGALIQRKVSVPAWMVALLAIAIVLGPTLAAVSLWESGSEQQQQDLTAAEATPTAESEESDDEVPLALEVDEMFDSRQWDEPAPPEVSKREQYLREQGVDPDQEVRYPADEVERLQAEIEAIQRNSAMLRSLARQQSGDLSEAYSSLEASQEHADGALEDLQERIDELEGRIQAVDELARELRDLLGMPPSESGMGGPLPSVAGEEEQADPWLTLRSDIVAIEQWAGTLVFDLDEVNTEIQLRMAQMEQAGVDRGPDLSADIEYYESMPMGWPVDGPITSRFGIRSSPFAGEGGASEMHTGIDIAARTGTPVTATGGGTIQVASDQGGYGLLVVIDHGRGVTSWYGHNSRLLVSPGQQVNAGDVIAEVGSTGRSTGPHVHYEVRVNGVPEDPLPYMRMSR